jgi:hypothetical protein
MDKWILEILFLLGGAGLAGFQWLIKNWVRNLEENMKELQKATKDIDIEVRAIKETYVPKADLKDIKDEIINRLARIENHLMGDKRV